MSAEAVAGSAKEDTISQGDRVYSVILGSQKIPLAPGFPSEAARPAIGLPILDSRA
jgi:hypothetical protein